ncbi:GNAT family N-acetyltransferase [Brachybacterium hainanense]|uniref:GNAT family N-acetyltransferase n=1 Tax=Brachybacterium hainanense TaxID=1541174 RepID=A0ABV6RA43_9MICO
MIDSALLPVHGDRVSLRVLQEADAAAFADGAADPAVQEYGHLPEPEYSPASVREMIRAVAVPGLERGDLAVLAIARRATDAFAGSLVIFDVQEQGAEVGFWVHPGHRGLGIATAALDLACRLCRASGLTELRARTVPDNSASQRTLGAAGFALERTAVDTTPAGERIALLHYARPLDDPAASASL